MSVVMQAAFGVEVLALEAQRLVENLVGVAGEAGKATVCGVLGGPDDVAAV